MPRLVFDYNQEWESWGDVFTILPTIVCAHQVQAELELQAVEDTWRDISLEKCL